MKPSDHAPLIAIVMLAARADGETDAAERAAIDNVVERIGAPDVSQLAKQVSAGTLRVADLAGRLSGPEARRAAYTSALAVCHADGATNDAERVFLDELRNALGLDAAAVAELDHTAGGLSAAPATGQDAAPVQSGSPDTGDAALEDFILDQAILTGALEILPDHLANIAILPLQMRMVYQIGQRHGQQLDLAQAKDLAATLGLGAAAQAVEGVAIKLLGGLAGGLLGGLMGGATRVATGAAITFGRRTRSATSPTSTTRRGGSSARTISGRSSRSSRTRRTMIRAWNRKSTRGRGRSISELKRARVKVARPMSASERGSRRRTWNRVRSTRD